MNATSIAARATTPWRKTRSVSPRRHSRVSSTTAATSSSCRRPGCRRGGRRGPGRARARRARTPPRRATYAVTKDAVPRRVQRTHAHAAAKPAMRYMLNMSRWPPHAVWVACMAADAGPSSTTTQARTVPTVGRHHRPGRRSASDASGDEQPGDHEARVGEGVGRLADPAVVGCLAEVGSAPDVRSEPPLGHRHGQQGDRRRRRPCW